MKSRQEARANSSASGRCSAKAETELDQESERKGTLRWRSCSRIGRSSPFAYQACAPDEKEKQLLLIPYYPP
jgi:hypothetical protein